MLDWIALLDLNKMLWQIYWNRNNFVAVNKKSSDLQVYGHNYRNQWSGSCKMEEFTMAQFAGTNFVSLSIFICVFYIIINLFAVVKAYSMNRLVGMNQLLEKGVIVSQFGRLNQWLLHFLSSLLHSSDPSIQDKQECQVLDVIFRSSSLVIT